MEILRVISAVEIAGNSEPRLGFEAHYKHRAVITRMLKMRALEQCMNARRNMSS